MIPINIKIYLIGNKSNLNKLYMNWVLCSCCQYVCNMLFRCMITTANLHNKPHKPMFFRDKMRQNQLKFVKKQIL